MLKQLSLSHSIVLSRQATIIRRCVYGQTCWWVHVFIEMFSISLFNFSLEKHRVNFFFLQNFFQPSCQNVITQWVRGSCKSCYLSLYCKRGPSLLLNSCPEPEPGVVPQDVLFWVVVLLWISRDKILILTSDS